MAGFSAYQQSPVTQQAVVTVNAGFDRFFSSYRKAQKSDAVDDRYTTTDDNCYTVMQRELVFRLNPSYNRLINRPDTQGVNDMALKVFSSANKFPNANSLKVRLSGDGLSERESLMRNAVSFVGVATTPVDYMNTNQKDTLAVQVGGSCTIWNTGTKVIRPGQKIIWDFPDLDLSASSKLKRKISGEPIEKKLFATMPLESAYLNSSGQATDFVTAIFGVDNPLGDPKGAEGKSLKASISKLTTGPESVEAHKQYLKKVIVMYEELRARVIGIALSGAAPGEVRTHSLHVFFC